MPTNPLFYNQFKFLTVEDESINTHSGDARQLAEFIQKEAGDRRDGSCEEMMQNVSEIKRVMGTQN